MVSHVGEILLGIILGTKVNLAALIQYGDFVEFLILVSHYLERADYGLGLTSYANCEAW